MGFSVREGVLWSESLLVQLPVEGAERFGPRVYLQSTLRVRGSSRIALEAALLAAFDDATPAGVAPWDVVLRAGLVFTLL